MSKKDHAKMICDIGELGGLFKDATSLETFLQKIVEMVAEHMHSNVCSIYLYDDKERKLVLKATKGLSSSAVGTIKLGLGEGLTGLALQERKPICERNASKNPAYHYFKGIGEESYESFLAVPILHGQVRIGVLVIQNVKTDYFRDDDITAMRAISSQLANTIEMTKVLMDIEAPHISKSEQQEKVELKLIEGKVGAEGLAYGQAVVLDSTLIPHEAEQALLKRAYSKEEFHAAVETTEKQLEYFQQQIEKRFSDVASMIFAAQILMLKDKAFVGTIEQLIEKGTHPVRAIQETIDSYIKLFGELPNAYLRERIQDVKDIGRRLFKNLIGADEYAEDHEGRIIVAEEMFPSDIFKLCSQKVEGIILLRGGINSHVSILSRSIGIPLIIVSEKDILKIPGDAHILIDGETGHVHVDPQEEIVQVYRQKEKDKETAVEVAKHIQESTYTKDGVRVRLFSNINLLGDATLARTMKSEGIGLYRTEFPFLIRSNFPTEEEQFIIYKKLTEIMPDKEITFRTLDIGGDKIISYYDYGKENNPFLGMRSIRFSLRHKDLFTAQIRAILRAGADSDLKIMFPMISSLDEFLEAKKMVRECVKSLRHEKISAHKSPKIGMMIELPSVLEIIDDLACEADFFSIGTNDFIQYMLAVDRTNERISDIYLPHHPAVFRGLEKIVRAARQQKIGLSICGDMVHDLKYLPYILGLGILDLSLDARLMPKVQKFIQGLDLEKATRKTSEILKYKTIHDIERVLAKDTKIFSVRQKNS